MRWDEIKRSCSRVRMRWDQIKTRWSRVSTPTVLVQIGGWVGAEVGDLRTHAHRGCPGSLEAGFGSCVGGKR